MRSFTFQPSFAGQKSLRTPHISRQITFTSRTISCSTRPPERAIVEAEPTQAPSDCRTCGAAAKDIPRGCDQEGRVAGGIGALVGFDWWPIKAYRPCPVAAKAGVLYNRKGQITDEMLFGKRKERQ